MLKEQGGWGSSGTALDNKAEIPAIPETSKNGLKFDASCKRITSLLAMSSLN